MNQNAGKNIILGITGSIAAYKSASALRGLMERGHQVQVAMTPAAQQFVTPTTFRSLSGRPVVTRLFADEDQVGLRHVELAEWVDTLAVVPATANFMGKVANGIADEILSCTWMASDCPKVVAPAMNDSMWTSPPVERNYEYLRLQTGVHFVGPVKGTLASGKEGMGHLAAVEDIVEVIHSVSVG